MFSPGVPLTLSTRRSQQPADSLNVVSSFLYLKHVGTTNLRPRKRRRRRRRHMPRLRERMHLSQQENPGQLKQKCSSYSHLYLYFHHLFSTEGSSSPAQWPITLIENKAHCAPKVSQGRCGRGSQQYRSPHPPLGNHIAYIRLPGAKASRSTPKSPRRRPRGCQGCVGGNPFGHERLLSSDSPKKSIRLNIFRQRGYQIPEQTPQQEGPPLAQRQEEVSWQRRYRSNRELSQLTFR